MAALFMLGALGMGAGMQGLPFVQDTENAADAVWRHFTGRNPGLGFKMQDILSDAGFGKIGAAIAMHGPLSVLTGMDLGSRIGFGDVVSRSLDGANALGAIPSIMWNAWAGAKARWDSGQDAAAIAAEMAPMAARGPLRALAAEHQGILSRSGATQVVKPDDLSGGDLARLALGFQPLSVSNARAERERFYQARQGMPAVRNEIRSGHINEAVQEMARLGMAPAQIRGILRGTLRGPTDRGFQRFEQQRAAPQ